VSFALGRCASFVDSAAQKNGKIKAYFPNAVFFLCAFMCFSPLRFRSSRFVRVGFFPRILRYCSGVLRFACVREYSGVGVMRFAFVSSKYFGCGVCFAFARGVSALVKSLRLRQFALQPKQINTGLTRRCTRPPTAPFAAFRSQARSTSLSPLPAAGELVVVLPRIVLY
jgi:hypothetical protein